MNVFKSNRFTYNHQTRIFATEASDLPEMVFSYPYITIESIKTGQTKDFTFIGKLQENEQYDGEIYGWEFISVDGYKIHLYND
jgi:hypothetical protein